MDQRDLIIIGGGQSALACGYFLRRTEINYLILDASPECGGAWLNAWDSLTLFSPPEYSSLPGWFMPESKEEFPDREEVISYLCAYEKRYELPVQRPVKVLEVTKDSDLFTIKTSDGTYQSKAVISATGTFGKPFIPPIPGWEKFQGVQLHSSGYRNAKEFSGQKVLVVGEGNSGAQILAEISKVATAKWSTRKEPEFLPDNVDGRVLFDVASAMYHAEQKGEKFDAAKYNLSNIVMVPPVKEARERGVLQSSGSFREMDENGVIWDDGTHENFDAIIWCTGFRYATSHLDELLDTDEQGKVKTDDTKAVEMPGLWLVGYGGWTGFASATLIGVGRSAKKTVMEVEEYIKGVD
ncbi:MAG: ArsO family NAD(P)H-dependent flavin-containing monooxygenase [Crocinitomicaceae bacterium]